MGRLKQRDETLSLNMELKYADVEKHKATILAINPDALKSPIQPGDSLNFTYTVFVEYLGKVKERLENILELKRQGVLIKTDYDCLDDTHSTIMEIGKLFTNIKQGASK